MIKKITLATVATLALITMPAQAIQSVQGNNCGAGMDGNNAMCNTKTCHGTKGSPLLLRLPNLMRVLTMHVDDAKLALTAEQKAKLDAGRNERMPKMMKYKTDIAALKKEIAQGSKAGATVSELKAKVEKLGALKTEATLLKLKCIQDTKAILSKDQMARVQELRKEQRMQRKAKKKAKMQGMKCAAGKCGGKK